MRFSFLVFISFIFLSTSCFSQKEKLKHNVVYHLESVFIGAKKNILAKNKATLTFNLPLKTAHCDFRCNFFDTKYRLKKNKIKFSTIVSGAIPCPDILLGLESDLKENFAKINRYYLSTGKIYFFDKKDTLLIFHEY